MTQKEIVLAVLKDRYLDGINDGWTRNHDIRGTATPHGFVGDAADVRLRELRKEGKAESRRVGKFEEYRIVLSENPTQCPRSTESLPSDSHPTRSPSSAWQSSEPSSVPPTATSEAGDAMKERPMSGSASGALFVPSNQPIPKPQKPTWSWSDQFRGL